MENTFRFEYWQYELQDHLHIRGEYFLNMLNQLSVVGSPPHTWRILIVIGKLRPLLRDHLHIRGEYIDAFETQYTQTGSPPHTWRIHKVRFVVTKTDRITSTYVENTVSLRELSPFLKDHLHIRGEYGIYWELMQHEKGSPPHTWRIPPRDALS